MNRNIWGAAVTLIIGGAVSVDLSPEIGHQVEVTGTISKEVNSRQLHGSNDTSQTKGEPGNSGTKQNAQTEGASTKSAVGAAGAKSLSTWQHLRVIAVRQLATSCTSR